MVRGLDIFREFFRDFQDQYILIGGAACNILLSKSNFEFRVTRDLDIVLIVSHRLFKKRAGGFFMPKTE